MFPQQNNYPHQYQYGAQQGYLPGGQVPAQYPQPMQYPQVQRPLQQTQGYGYPGATPFPQYPGYQGQYHQPVYNPMPGAYTSSGPPAKRHKANTVVTRYPMSMSPGYSLPTPAQGPGPTAPQPYNAMTQQHRHSFAQPSTNPQSGWNAQPTTNFSQPRPSTQPQAGRSLQNPWQQPFKSPAQQFPQPIGPPKPGSSAGPSPATTPTVSVSAPKPAQSAASAHSAGGTSVGATFNQMHHDPAYAYEVDFETSEEVLQSLRSASAAGDTTETDQKLSLGIITWHPPRLITSPLASTFELAQVDLVSPPAPRKPEDSISKYHGPEMHHLFGVSVRSTPDWNSVRDDIIFRRFDDNAGFVPLRRARGQRDRPPSSEGAASEREPVNTGTGANAPEAVVGPAAREPYPARTSIRDGKEATACAVDADGIENTEPADVDSERASTEADRHPKSDDSHAEQHPKREESNAAKAPNPLDHLEEMLAKASRQSAAVEANGHRSRSVSGRSSHGSASVSQHVRASPATDAPRGESQAPASFDASRGQESRNQSRAGPAPTAPAGQPLYGFHNIPPPPPPEPVHRTGRAQRPVSDDNLPDVEMEDEPASEDSPPKERDNHGLGRTSSTKKRTFEEAQGPQQEQRRRQDDDLTPRLRRQRQKLEPA